MQRVWGTAGTMGGGAVTGDKRAGRATELVTGSDSGWDLDSPPTGRTCFQIEQEARKERNQGLKHRPEGRRCRLGQEEGAGRGEEPEGALGAGVAGGQAVDWLDPPGWTSGPVSAPMPSYH